ncbi:MAG: hypothetical protein D3915_06545 [Candidatus Electrothrix sp. AU1_5]|nr:hypothetical protein [Candidatus Electrothrix gigas]
MAIISKTLLFFFVGVLSWAYLQPNEMETYFFSLAVFFILFILYIGNCGTMPTLQITSLRLKKMKLGMKPSICYTIENIGDGEAKSIHIETRINMVSKKNNGEVSSILIPSQNSKFFLPKHKTLEKSQELTKIITASEMKKIEQGELFLSAYSLVRYKNEQCKVQRELRTCSVYNPKTQYFEKTFCTCVEENWPYAGVNQPISHNYVNC